MILLLKDVELERGEPNYAPYTLSLSLFLSLIHTSTTPHARARARALTHTNAQATRVVNAQTNIHPLIKPKYHI